jgi:hypothetical protein
LNTVNAGLGLTISAYLAKGLAGSNGGLRLKSIPEKKTKFYFLA